MNDAPSLVNVPTSLVGSWDVRVKLQCSHTLPEQQVGSSMIFVADMDLNLATEMTAQAQYLKARPYYVLVRVKSTKVGVRIVGSGPAMEEGMEEDFVEMLDTLHDCSKVGSR